MHQRSAYRNRHPRIRSFGNQYQPIFEPLEDRRLLASWTPVGPAPILGGQTAGLVDQDDPVAGAVQVVAPHPTNANILYVGAVNGGVWRTDNAQSSSPSWTPLTDHLPSSSIGDLQFDPTDTTNNTLVVGFGRFSSLARDGDELRGLARTTNGGQTWTEITGGGLLIDKNVTSVAARGDVILVAVNGATPFSLENLGIFRSVNGGSSFARVSGAAGSGLPLGRSLEMVSDPIDPSVLYASVSDAGANNGIYKSTNTGASWTRVSSPEMNNLIIDSGGSRTSNVQISVGRSNNLYVGIVNGGQLAAVYRSGNGGTDWTAMDVPQTNEDGTSVGLNPIKTGRPKPDGRPADDPGGQGAIHFSILADPTNPNLVYVGGDRQPRGALDQGNWPNSIGATNFTGRLFRGDATLAAGSQWTPLTDDFADPDGADGPLPGTGPHADSRDMAFDVLGNLIEGDDGGVYRRISPTSATGVWQSLNGSLQITEFVSVAYSGLTNTVFGGAQDVGTSYQTSSDNNVWEQFAQADGGVVAVDESQPGISIRYGSSQFFGNFGRATFNAAGDLVNFTPADLNGLSDAPQFYTPFELNALQPSRLVIGTESRLYESFDRADNVTDLGAFGTVDAIAYGGASAGVPNPDVLYVGTNLGLFLRTSVVGGLQPLNSYPGLAPVDIVLDPLDWRRAIVVDSLGIFLTPDAGDTWTNITLNLEDDRWRTVEYVSAASGSTGIVVGGNAGVFVLRFGANFWQEAATGLPGAPVIDLHYHSGDDVLLAGTLGRGAWIIEGGSAVLTPPGLEVSDVLLAEGTGGSTDFVFIISQPVSALPVTVVYSTADGSAIADSDYLPQSGSLTFLPGETTKQITIQVIADFFVEPNEQFLVVLSDVENGTISKSTGIGTILNDDVDISINDVVVNEGNVGTRQAVFTVSVAGLINRPISFTYSTINNTAQGASDYLPVAGGIALPEGVTTAQIVVPIIGDRIDEADETFFVMLTSAQGARIADGIGQATIIDEDPLPSLYVSDAQVTTTEAGTYQVTFSVALDVASGRQVNVNYSTADFSAIAGVDYIAKSGVLSFAPGAINQLVTVDVMTSGVPGANKRFSLNMTGVSNAEMGDSRGDCYIVYADEPQNEFIIDNGAAGYSRSFTGWTTLTNTLAYQQDFDYASAGNGSAFANWNFAAIPNGSYQIFTRWSHLGNRATNAPFTVYSGLGGNSELGTTLVNQQLAPVGDFSNGVAWQSIGTFEVTSNTLRVRLANNANGYVVGDAIRIVGGGIGFQSGEIDVAGFGRSIATGDVSPAPEDATDFGAVPSLGVTFERTFTITNNGNADLVLTGNPFVAIGGPHTADFTVTQMPAPVIAPGGKSDFKIAFRATDVGFRSATVSIANTDDSEHPFEFVVQGYLAPAAAALAHNGTLPQDVNDDGRVNTSDALMIINHLLTGPAAAPLVAGISAEPLTAPSVFYDVVPDGRVNTSDLLSIFNRLLTQSAAAQPLAAQPLVAQPLAGSVAEEALVLFVLDEDSSDEPVAVAHWPSTVESTIAARPHATAMLLVKEDELALAGDEEIDPAAELDFAFLED